LEKEFEMPKANFIFPIILLFTVTAARAQQTGLASYISNVFEGRPTASGAVYNQDSLVCGHNTYPFGTILKVTHLENGRSVRVRVIDRGPGIPGRIVNLSRAAAERIDMIEEGVVRVEVETAATAEPDDGGEVVYLWLSEADSLQWQYSRNKPAGWDVPNKGVESAGFELQESRSDGQYTIKTMDPLMRDEAETMLWESAEAIGKIDLYQAYVNTYPNGQYADQARARIAALSKERQGGIVEQLRGRLAYLIPDTMLVNSEYRVGMEISADTTAANLREMIRSYSLFSENEEKVQAELIRIGRAMRAVLTDPSPAGNRKFNIVSFGASDKRNVQLTSREPSLWEWVVTPLRKGDHKLYFSIEIVVEDEGGEVSEVIPVKEAEVLVVVEPNFLQRYAWLLLSIGAILAAVLLFILRRGRKQEKEAIQQLPFDSIRERIGAGRLIEAVDTLHDAFEAKEGKAYREVVLLKTRLESCEEKARKGILSNDEVTRERNKITDDLLALLENIRE
jgi:rare lipoprotein A